jgi:hypothetical protein
MADLFGLDGTRLLDRLTLPAPYAARIASLRRLMDSLDFEVDLFTGLVRSRLAADPGYLAVQTIPASGPPWPRCSPPRSATSAASPPPRSWPAGPG